MQVLVIGGTRFVGLRLVRLLAQKGHDITLLNRGKSQAPLLPGLKRLYADRRDPKAIASALQGQEYEVVFDITGYQVRSLEPVVQALESRVGHYIFQSTCGVYAHSPVVPVKENFPRLSPATGLSGFAAYEIEKVQCEDYLLKAYSERGFPITIFRCPVIYGPENWMDEREGSYFARLTLGKPILLPDNPATILTFVHADDVAQAHLAAAGKKNTFGQAYNISEPDGITINGYIDAIAEAMRVVPKKVFLSPQAMKSLTKPLFPFPWEYSDLYDISKARVDFGFWPHYNIKSGLKHSYEWWKEAKGIEGTKFIPGRLGYDVDLAYEGELAQRYS